jgi:hypothetical protein
MEGRTELSEDHEEGLDEESGLESFSCTTMGISGEHEAGMEPSPPNQ